MLYSAASLVDLPDDHCLQLSYVDGLLSRKSSRNEPRKGRDPSDNRETNGEQARGQDMISNRIEDRMMRYTELYSDEHAPSHVREKFQEQEVSARGSHVSTREDEERPAAHARKDETSGSMQDGIEGRSLKQRNKTELLARRHEEEDEDEEENDLSKEDEGTRQSSHQQRDLSDNQVKCGSATSCIVQDESLCL